MTRRRTVHGVATPLPSVEHPTVASLGVRVRLVPSRRARAQEIAELIAASQRLRRDWDALFQRLVDCLEAERRR